jgi:hypothetical protein
VFDTRFILMCSPVHGSMHAKFFELSLFCFIFRVNKPYLPIAAGDLSVQSAWLLVIFFAVTGLLIVGLNFGSFITSLYCLGLFLGTIYSVPPFRMKRFPVAAFLIIATVWLLFFVLIILTFDAHTRLNRISVRHKRQNM